MTGTIPGMVERAALEYAGQPALIDNCATVTFDELHEQVRAAAGAMIEAGVEAGERVAVMGSQVLPMGGGISGRPIRRRHCRPGNVRHTAVEACDLVARADCRPVIVEGELHLTQWPKKQLSPGNPPWCHSGRRYLRVSGDQPVLAHQRP